MNKNLEKSYDEAKVKRITIEEYLRKEPLPDVIRKIVADSFEKRKQECLILKEGKKEF